MTGTLQAVAQVLPAGPKSSVPRALLACGHQQCKPHWMPVLEVGHVLRCHKGSCATPHRAAAR